MNTLEKELKLAIPGEFISVRTPNPYLTYEDNITLDGNFTVDELETIIKIVRKYMKQTEHERA